MEGENVEGYRLGTSYACNALRYKWAVIATWQSARFYIEGPTFRSPAGGMEIF